MVIVKPQSLKMTWMIKALSSNINFTEIWWMQNLDVVFCASFHKTFYAYLIFFLEHINPA
jgi:hypothetical protein